MDYIEQLKRLGNNIYPNTVDKAVLDSNGTPLDVRLAVLEEMIEGLSHQELVHEVEVWADYECTTRPTGEVNHVYVQLNRDFKFDECTIYRASTFSEGTQLSVDTTTPEYSTDPYTITCWVDFMSSEQSSYFTAGQVLVAFTNDFGDIDVTGFQTSFGELIPKPEIQRYRGVIANFSSRPLPTILTEFDSGITFISKYFTNGSAWEHTSENDLYLLGAGEMGAYYYCCDQFLNHGNTIPIGRVLMRFENALGHSPSHDVMDQNDAAPIWRDIYISAANEDFTEYELSLQYNYDLSIFEPKSKLIAKQENLYKYHLDSDDNTYSTLIESIEFYNFKHVSKLVFSGVPELPTASGNIGNVTIDTTAYGELTADQLVSKLNIQRDGFIECEVVDDYIKVVDGPDYFYKISKSSTPTIWEVESLFPVGVGPQITTFQAIEDSWVPIYNDGREE